MQNDYKRKLTSRLNALKSTGPNTPDGKLRSAANSITHGANAKNLILPGEELADFQSLINAPPRYLATCQSRRGTIGKRN